MAASKKTSSRRSTVPGAKGRTSITGKNLGPSASRRHTQIEKATQAARPVSSGAGPRRGDRRDMHPKFSTGKTHSAGGKRGPIGSSTRKGGTND